MYLRLITILAVFSFISCKTNTKKDEPAIDAHGTYFSIKQFIKDQFDTYGNQPFGFQKLVYKDGVKDSSLTNVEQMNWGAVIQPFFQSDISDKRFLGHYIFSKFNDEATATVNYYYEAKEDSLFTRKLQIMADDQTSKVRSIYIETESNTRWDHSTQKLFYIPLNIISIQKFDHSNPGQTKELRIEYRFLH